MPGQARICSKREKFWETEGVRLTREDCIWFCMQSSTEGHDTHIAELAESRTSTSRSWLVHNTEYKFLFVNSGPLQHVASRLSMHIHPEVLWRFAWNSYYIFVHRQCIIHCWADRTRRVQSCKISTSRWEHTSPLCLKMSDVHKWKLVKGGTGIRALMLPGWLSIGFRFWLLQKGQNFEKATNLWIQGDCTVWTL